LVTFWTPSKLDAPWPSPESEPPRGSLAEVLPWLESAPSEAFKHEFNSSQAILAILRSTPAALKTLCSTPCSSDEQMNWTLQSEPGEWSLTEVICHLRDVETEVFEPRFEKIINEDNPFIVGIDSDPWAEQRQYIRQDGPQALSVFISKRKELISLLSALPPEDWQRPARHAIFGPTHLQELASFVSEHDRLHIQQIIRLIKH